MSTDGANDGGRQVESNLDPSGILYGTISDRLPAALVREFDPEHEWIYQNVDREYEDKDGERLTVTYWTIGQPCASFQQAKSAELLHRSGAPAATGEKEGHRCESWWVNGLQHREDGPAEMIVEDGGTSEWWCHQGQIHRDNDLPAYVRADSSGFMTHASWWQYGEMHREDGPASLELTQAGAIKQGWFQNGEPFRPEGPTEVGCDPDDGPIEECWTNSDGKLHRDDGPALICKWPNGVRGEGWYQNDLLHREDGPAQIETDADGATDRTWFVHGVKHRDNGPAEIQQDRNGRVIGEGWYQRGLLHHEGAPAKTSWSGDRRISEWYREGAPYRDGDKPTSVEWANTGIVLTESWSNSSGLHRVGGPARIVRSNRGEIIEEVWSRNGEKHREDGPAVLASRIDGSLRIEEWYDDGELHRVEGPARSVKGDNGQIELESWYRHGALHRENGPAQLSDEPDSYVEWWYLDGLEHRVGGPAFIEDDGDGYVEKWMQEGRLHREDGPALLCDDSDGERIKEGWYKKGNRHRDDDGPARIYLDEEIDELVAERWSCGNQRQVDEATESKWLNAWTPQPKAARF